MKAWLYIILHKLFFVLLSPLPDISGGAGVRCFLLIPILILSSCRPSPSLDQLFLHPPESAKPWVFWYWVKAGVSKEGITADLEAMKEAGIGGAYLITVQGADDPSLFNPPAEQLTPEWWDMVRFAFSEAKRLGLKMAMHACDGFSTAGGPWITPEMSMQKIVWSEMRIPGSQNFHDTLPQPETMEGFYRDIALFAYPSPAGAEFNTHTVTPTATTNLKGEGNMQYLCDPENTEVFRSDENCWIQYAFEQPFMCRTISIRTKGLNYQSHRLIIESSNDGIHFSRVCRLEPPRHGWQDYEVGITHSIPATTARYFRFVYDKEGTEPGSEDLDAARWNPALKIQGITLSGEAVIHQFEGKNGSIWRVGKRTTAQQVPDSLCIPMDRIVNISKKLDHDGILTWEVPEGNWTILRIGHTSTGKTNYIGGKGKGLECDKFDPEIARYQFNHWFGKVFMEVDPALAGEVLKVFHTDSWECGSQNWSPVFSDEFEKRRGYSLLPYLPAMTGLPVENIKVSEGFLYDVRQTISELVADNFFGTMAELAKAKGCLFSSESVAPVMVSDAMQHYSMVDIPMGEFWLNSPTHDKPTDILDAISAAHIYGKPVVQAESFTTLRMDWTENPGKLKTVGDRNFALGINRMVFHVFVHNPWTDRKPGMTLNGVGLYFQRDQTWWKQGMAWMDYIRRCQAMLQQGIPVVDIAVYTGEEIPRRAMTPDRLAGILPGLFDPGKLEAEKARLANAGVPMQEKPDGVSNSANTFDPAQWTDPLRGYKFDSFNKDALLRLAQVKDGKIVLPGGMTYSILVIPGKHKMNPDHYMSAEVLNKIKKLIDNGATVIFSGHPELLPGLYQHDQAYEHFNNLLNGMMSDEYKIIETTEGSYELKILGKGRLIKAPYYGGSFTNLGIDRDFSATENNNSPVVDIAWNHRRSADAELYFISNQQERPREVKLSVRTDGYVPEIFDPLDGNIRKALNWESKNGRTVMSLRLEANASLFLVFRQKTNEKESRQGNNWLTPDTLMNLDKIWSVSFDPASGGPSGTVQMAKPGDWTGFNNDSIRYYSGTATYRQTFEIDLSRENDPEYLLDLGIVADIAEVWVNGQPCGTAWTFPYRVDISKAVRPGRNDLEIKVTNTWRNRVIGDHTNPAEKQITWTMAPYRLEGKSLAPSGLLGPVVILSN